MTTTQVEQKARAVKLLHQETRKVIDDIALLIQKADENDSIVKALPPTFYADLPLYKRVEFMWEQWNRAIKCLQELELQNDSLIQKADALDLAVKELEGIQSAGYILTDKGNFRELFFRCTALLSAINQARNEQ